MNERMNDFYTAVKKLCPSVSVAILARALS